MSPLIDGLDAQIDPVWEKLAFHLRRSWPREEVVREGPGIAQRVTDELLRLAPLVDDVNGHSEHA